MSKSAKARDIDAIKPAPAVEVGPIKAPVDEDEEVIGGQANVPVLEDTAEWANWKDMKDGMDKAKDVQEKQKKNVEGQEALRAQLEAAAAAATAEDAAPIDVDAALHDEL